MTTLICPTTKTLPGEWEDVYSVQEVTKETFAGMPPGFYKGVKTYYQTFGGGPEGGYIVKGQTTYRVSRGWFEKWQVEELKNTIVEYEPEDFKAGKTARCRKVEVYSLRETRAIVDEHVLWGNAIEIVKCLRDGLGRAGDASYKDLCLGIILDNFAYIDKHLDILPPDSCAGYKEVLTELVKEHTDKEDESDEEEETPVCEGCKDTLNPSTMVTTSEDTLLCEKCWT